MDRADVWMIEGRRGLRLAVKPGEGMRITGYILRQKLERDETVETSILSLVDDPHPAAAEFLDDMVMRDGLADHGRRGQLLARILGALQWPSQLLCYFLEQDWFPRRSLLTPRGQLVHLRVAHFTSQSIIPKQTKHLQVTGHSSFFRFPSRVGAGEFEVDRQAGWG